MWRPLEESVLQDLVAARLLVMDQEDPPRAKSAH
jgi:hypothetical protein